MKALRAIILLVIYTAFTMGAAFAKHSCGEHCIGGPAGTHTGDASLPPAECSEKEVVTGQLLEHRSGSTVKFTLLTSVRFHSAQKVFVSDLNLSLSNGRRDKPWSPVPIYVENCVYRL